MAQKAFFPEFNKFCLEWATPAPGSVTTYGGPLRVSDPRFRTQLQFQKEAIFEQLLLFDSIQFNVTGPNLICPLMYEFMGPKALEGLLEQDALSFVIWQPVPMMSHHDGKVAATFTGSIGDGKGSEFDIERIVDDGLRLYPTDMPRAYRRQLARKLLKVHSTPKAEIPASAWNNTQEALKRGELFDLGLPAAETPIGLSSGDGQLLLGVAESLMHYRYVIENDMVSQNSAGVFDLFQIGLRNLKERQSPVEKYSIIAVWEKFPDLKSLLGEIESPFTRIARFRQTHTAVRFRDWLSTAAGTDLELVREYVNACAERRRLFESKPARFMKIVSLIALSHVAGFEATATVGAVLMTRIPSEIINEVLKLSAEVGTGVIDSFLIDNLQVGWTPKAYFDGLRKLRRNEPENKSS